MRVCLDIQSAIGARAGVGRYTKLLAEHLAPLRGPNELALFHFDFQRRGMSFTVDEATTRACRWVPGRFVQKSWKSIHWPPYTWFAGHAEVYHFPNFIRPPLPTGASVVTIHDLAFLRYPETIEKKNLAFLTSQIEQTVERATAIITVSEFTAREAQELLHVPASKLHAIHSGLDPALKKPTPETIKALRSRFELHRPYLLSVGTLEPRKNFAFLVDVFDHLEKFNGDLVIAGRRGWKFEPLLDRIARSPRRDRIRLIDSFSDSDLPALYGGAELFLLPSLYEGFGFPPLEAMACGTPTLVAPGGSLEEVCGGGAIVLPNQDTARWVSEITALLQAPGARDALRQRGADFVSRYSWHDTARKTWDVYQHAHAEYTGRRATA